jgi:hypothetical protein
MSLAILNVLSDGPTPYGEFIGLGLDKNYVDVHLRLARKLKDKDGKRVIEQDASGRYRMATPTPPEEDDSVYAKAYYSENRLKILAQKKAQREKYASRKTIWCKGCGLDRPATDFVKRETVFMKPLCYPCKYAAKARNK